MSDSPQLSNDVLASIVCPLTRSKLRQEGDELVAQVGGLRYPVREGIPVLLADQATLPEGYGSLDEFRQAFGSEISKAGDVSDEAAGESKAE